MSRKELLPIPELTGAIIDGLSCAAIWPELTFFQNLVEVTTAMLTEITISANSHQDLIREQSPLHLP